MIPGRNGKGRPRQGDPIPSNVQNLDADDSTPALRQSPPDAPPMTRREREDLAKVARLRARVARSAIVQREAELLADVEAQLAVEYASTDEAWADITKGAVEAVAEADRQVAALCRERGIPEEFRPGLNVSWYARGRNAEASRRGPHRAFGRRAVLGRRPHVPRVHPERSATHAADACP